MTRVDALRWQVDGELDGSRPATDDAGGAELAEQPEHLAVLGQCDSGEPCDALFAGAFDQRLEQRSAEPLPLPVVHNGHSDLGGRRVGFEADEARHAGQLARNGVEPEQRFVIAMIDVGQEPEHPIVKLGQRDEESPVARFGAEPLKATADQVLVLRGHGPNVHRGPAAKPHQGDANRPSMLGRLRDQDLLGGMFWLRWNRLVGSYSSLRAWRRANFSSP